MNINESWHDDAPTSPFVNKEKRCAFKRPSYTGIPVLVSCIVLKGPLKCCLRAVTQLGGISSHFKTEFGFLQFVCVLLPLLLLKGPSFMVSLSFWSLGLLLGGGHSSSSLDVAVLSLCLLRTQRLAPLDSPDGPGWGSPGFGNGNWLISSCATRLSTVALCFAAFVCFWYWEHVRACPAWSLRICLTSRELSAKYGEGGLLGTLADIASSVHCVLVRLGDSGALGALSDSVEPSLLEELPLVSLEVVSVISSVPVVDKEPGLLSDVPLVSAALPSVDGPVSGTLS